MNAAMEDQTRALYLDPKNSHWRHQAAIERVSPVFIGTHGQRSEMYPDFTEKCPDFKSFLKYVSPDRAALFPESWAEAGLNEYYRKTIQKIAYILALVGEIYTKKDNLPLLEERIDRICGSIRRIDELIFEKEMDNRAYEKIRNYADKLVDKRNREASSEKLLEVFGTVKALRTQFEPLKEKLNFIKNLVPTSGDFIDRIQKQIASIKPSKIYFTKESIDNILTIDSQTVGIDLRGAPGLRDVTMITLAQYLQPGVTLDFATPVADLFRHNSDTKNWDFRLVQTNLQGVSHVTLCTIDPEEQNSIVRALIEKNILTPLRNDGLITDEKKAEEAPVDPAPVEKTYEENKEERKAALRKRQQERKKNKEEDQE
jgi:hypothetical protein